MIFIFEAVHIQSVMQCRENDNKYLLLAILGFGWFILTVNLAAGKDNIVKRLI